MTVPTPAIRSPAAPPRPPPHRRSWRTTPAYSQEAPTPPPPTSLSSRRAAFLLLAAAATAAASPPPPAAGFSLGIPGPKEWLREQKKKSARFVLAPIDASRQSLLKAQILLASANSAPESAEEVRRLLGSAARDCVPRERSSLVALQSRSGVEVRTFSLILKNAASLLPDKDPARVDADDRLSELVKSFSDLGIAVDNSNFELASDREKMEDGLMGTISALDKFEQGIKDCLGV